MLLGLFPVSNLLSRVFEGALPFGDTLLKPLPLGRPGGPGNARTSEGGSCAAVLRTGGLRGRKGRQGRTLKARVLQEESPALGPLGLKNLVLCQVKPSKRLTPVVLKLACFHVTHFKPRFHLSQGIVRVPTPSIKSRGAP